MLDSCFLSIRRAVEKEGQTSFPSKSPKKIKVFETIISPGAIQVATIFVARMEGDLSRQFIATFFAGNGHPKR